MGNLGKCLRPQAKVGPEHKPRSKIQILRFFIQRGLTSTFPNVEVILTIFLTIPASNASAERFFNVLTRMKNYLRNILGQDKLSNLSILSIKSEVTNCVDFNELINNFAAKKPQYLFKSKYLNKYCNHICIRFIMLFIYQYT
ncbi:Zinc finger MYM-type protein 1 [Anthophora quadrimaculata]